MVAWYEHGAAYWVGNTLNDTVPNGELLAIAEQTHPFATSGARAARAREQVRAATVPTGTSSSAKTDFMQTLGSLAGLLTLMGVPLLAITGISRRRELSDLRAQLNASSHVMAQLADAVARIAPARRVAEPTGASDRKGEG